MGVSTDKRASARIQTRFETAFRVQEKEGLGVLSDLSPTGARVEHCTWSPSIGSPVHLQIQIQEDREPLALDGSVVRLTDGGFVVHFEKLQDELRRALDAFELPLDDLIGGELLSEEALSGDSGAGDVGLEQYTVVELEALSSRIAAEIERKRR